MIELCLDIIGADLAEIGFSLGELQKQFFNLALLMRLGKVGRCHSLFSSAKMLRQSGADWANGFRVASLKGRSTFLFFGGFRTLQNDREQFENFAHWILRHSEHCATVSLNLTASVRSLKCPNTFS